jgi:hypothetical protein
MVIAKRKRQGRFSPQAGAECEAAAVSLADELWSQRYK